MEHPGDPRAEGVGAIRVASRPPLKIREQITAVEEPVRLAYRLLTGLPVSNYVGETVLIGDETGTGIVWTVTLTPRFPGTALAVRVGVRALVNGLVKEAQRVTRRNDRPP